MLQIRPYDRRILRSASGDICILPSRIEINDTENVAIVQMAKDLEHSTPSSLLSYSVEAIVNPYSPSLGISSNC